MTKCLIHTGFAKAGSTFLQEWFERNPQLRFTPHTLAGFSSVFHIADFAHEQPNREYRYFVTSNELLGSGGRIPYGCALFSFDLLRTANLLQGQKDICRTLRDIFPDARVLIVTRGFEGIIRSLYSQYVKLAGGMEFHPFLEAHTSILLQWLNVDHNIGVYREAFGRENVMVWPYEWMRADPVGFLKTLETALGLDHVDGIPGARNESLTREQMYWYALFSRRFVTPIAQRFSPKTAGHIYNWYGFRVVQIDRLRPIVSCLNRLSPRAADLTFPAGYLDQFRGLASSLAMEEAYAPFFEEYLLEPAYAGRRAG